MAAAAVGFEGKLVAIVVVLRREELYLHHSVVDFDFPAGTERANYPT